MAELLDDPEAVPTAARVLHLSFESVQAFRAEYARNLVKGGLFVPTDEPFDLREMVELRLALPFANEQLVLGAEVVHRVPPGVGPGGVAIQLLDPAPELRARFEAILARAPADAPAAPELDVDLEAAADDLSFADEAGDADAVPPAGFEPTGLGAGQDPNERTHRQRAERAPARVAVRVRGASGRPLVARTRNISSSGLLLSVEGEELPVGREVELELTHPGTGKVLPVRGKVVRHLPGDGVVPAVAVQMKPGREREAVEAFLAEVQRVDEEQRRGGIRGPLEELGAVSLLQMFAALAQRGTLTVTSGAEEGIVAFENGQLLLAQVGVVAGTKALARIFAWRDGFFEFRGSVDPLPPNHQPLPMEGAILDALRLLDEANRDGGTTLSPATRFTVHRERFGALEEPLGKTEEAVLELAAAGFTLRRILDVIPESDAQIREAIASLVERGLISAA